MDTPDYNRGRAAAYHRIGGLIDRGYSLLQLREICWAGELQGEKRPTGDVENVNPTAGAVR